MLPIVQAEAAVGVEAALRVALEDLRLLALAHLPDGVDGDWSRGQVEEEGGGEVNVKRGGREGRRRHDSTAGYGCIQWHFSFQLVVVNCCMLFFNVYFSPRPLSVTVDGQ